MERKNKCKSPPGNKVIGIKKWKGTRTHSANNGYVLIFSLWAIVIFGFIALSFTRNTSTAIKTEIAFTERIKNVYAARGSCIYATQMMVLPKKQGEEARSGNIKKRKVNNAKRKKKKKYSLGDPWIPSSTPYSIPIGDKSCDVFISDEGGKININKITDETKDGFIKFLISLKIKEHDAEIVTDSILDWLDEDDLHHVNGAEKDYYATLSEPYEPKNGPFESLEELALVKGITPEVFELLRKHLTIYGSGKININFASKEVLMFVPKVTQEMSDAIIQMREKKGEIKHLDKLKEMFRHFGVIGSDFQDILKFITIYDSSYLTIKAISHSDKMQSSYTIVVRKSVNQCRIIAAYPE